MSNEDEDLQEMFGELRRADAAPPFDASWAAAQRELWRGRRRRAMWAAGFTALAFAASIALWPGTRTPILTGVGDPEPLAFLLTRPGGPR